MSISTMTAPHMDFSAALHRLKEGATVARVGWNGKGMYLYFVPGTAFLVNRPPLLGLYQKETMVNYRGHIDMKCADGGHVPWVASQSDLLGEDWIEVKP